MLEESHSIDSKVEEEPFGLGCALELFTEVQEVFKMIEDLKTIYNDRTLYEKAYERFHFVIGQYKEQPHLLDSHLDELLGKFINIVKSEQHCMELKHSTFKYMFVLVNVRGYKVLVRHLPHEVADFESVLKLLEMQDHQDTETWTTRYILLLWLSIIVMIPFPLSRFDAETEMHQTGTMGRVLQVIKRYVIMPDKCSDAAAYLSSRFMSRNDVKEQHLSSYFDWCMSLTRSPASNVFIKHGTLSSVAAILKNGKREDLQPHIQCILQFIVNEDMKKDSGSSIQKLVYKIIQRIGLIFLPPRLASWRYNRGNRSLAANLSGGDGVCSKTESEPEPEEDVDVPDEVEEVIDQLIQGLRSADCIVRWSAAKGVGRVTGRLPQELADQVVGSVLELFNPREGDGAWHGGCLALAELGRRGLLLPKRLPEVIPVVLKALVYDEPRGYSSVGSHIRDAACFVCWSFARAYDIHILQPFVKDIAASLIIVTCYDREINCRRAASAAFQENVGRQGTFPNGIDILTRADFFAVSVRNHAYLDISVYIAQFDDYTIPLIDHLISRKVDHWDTIIRELTAKTLHNLTPKALAYMASAVLPALFEKTASIDLNTRHGAVLAIGEILYALAVNKCTLSENLLEKTKNLVTDFRGKFYFRGLGGELMKQACCDFIEKCSLGALPFHGALVTVDWLTLLNECIAYNVPQIQSVAIKALPVLLQEYFSLPEQKPKCDEIVQLYIHELSTSTHQEIRVGHALALGCLPKFILEANLARIIDALVENTKITPLTEKWAESRRDTMKALTSLAITMQDSIGTTFCDDYVLSIFHVFIGGLCDYTQDKRGDVGAWVREASMLGLQNLTLIVCEKSTTIMTETLMQKILAETAQQAVERIDRTRALAGKVFCTILYSCYTKSYITNLDDMHAIFTKDECDNLNWNSASSTFPKFVQLLQFPAYTYNVMLGLICSVGGLTETLVKNSGASLFDYLKQEETKKGRDEMMRLCNVIKTIFESHGKNDRIIIPVFRFLDKLFNSGCMRLVTDDPDCDWNKQILKLILNEISGCKDIYKLIDGINVLAQFIQFQSDTCTSALVQLSILLCHRQTFVRKSTSNILYEALLIYGDGAAFNTDNLEEIMQLLSSTNWEEPVDVVKPVRNELCRLMGIRVPVPKGKT